MNSFSRDQFIKVPGSLIVSHKASLCVFSSVPFEGDSTFILVCGVVHGQMKLGIPVKLILRSQHFLKLFDGNFRCTGNEVSNLTLVVSN